MRKQFLFLLFFLFARSLVAQKNEVGLALGGLVPQDRGRVPNKISLSGGLSYQANYAHRVIGGRTALYGEVHFLANPQRVVGSVNPAATRDVATLYVTPGVQVKFAAGSALSPYVALGGGADAKFWRWIGLRAEIRDFYTGSPAYNIPAVTVRQHNVVAGGGFVLKWGE